MFVSLLYYSVLYLVFEFCWSLCWWNKELHWTACFVAWHIYSSAPLKTFSRVTF